MHPQARPLRVSRTVNVRTVHGVVDWAGAHALPDGLRSPRGGVFMGCCVDPVSFDQLLVREQLERANNI